MEDLTNPERIRQNPKCDRTVSLYGYVRGVPLKKNTSIHIPGKWDYFKGYIDVRYPLFLSEDDVRKGAI